MEIWDGVEMNEKSVVGDPVADEKRGGVFVNVEAGVIDPLWRAACALMV